MEDKEKIQIMMDALKDPAFATMLWRGCVGLANETLRRVHDEDTHWIGGYQPIRRPFDSNVKNPPKEE